MPRQIRGKNVVGAFVHMDECTPHLHFSFVPVVVDKKKHDEKVCFQECCPRRDYQTFHPELSAHIEKALGYQVEILNEATRDGNRSVEELKRETAVKRLKALNDDLEAKRRACIEYGKVIDARFRPPPDAKENLFGNKVTLPKRDYELLCCLANQKGIESQEKVVLEVLLSERKELDSYKAVSEAQNQAKQAETENEVLRTQVNVLRRELHRILTAYPEIEKEREKEKEKSLSGMEREIC